MTFVFWEGKLTGSQFCIKASLHFLKRGPEDEGPQKAACFPGKPQPSPSALSPPLSPHLP